MRGRAEDASLVQGAVPSHMRSKPVAVGAAQPLSAAEPCGTAPAWCTSPQHQPFFGVSNLRVYGLVQGFLPSIMHTNSPNISPPHAHTMHSAKHSTLL